MKIFQIEGDICYWDATAICPSIKEAKRIYPPGLVFVEAPDHVFEGWGYLDGEFIRPTAPEGWLYDADTGTFYPEEISKPVATLNNYELSVQIGTLKEVMEDIDALLVDQEYQLTILRLGL